MPQTLVFRWTRHALAAVVFFASLIASAEETFVIVSDVDDTVKITNVRRPTHAIVNALKSELAFAGMSELYRRMLGPDSDETRLRFISGSSRALDGEVGETLKAAKFPAYSLTLRRIRESFVSASVYKTRHMNRLYGAAHDKFILIGDDTEADPEVYATFASSKPGQVLAIYIRRVVGRELPNGSTSFVTAYDIAAREREAGRLTQEQADAVAVAVLAATVRTLLPDFHACPSERDAATDGEDSLREEIQAKLAEICTARQR